MPLTQNRSRPGAQDRGELGSQASAWCSVAGTTASSRLRGAMRHVERPGSDQQGWNSPDLDGPEVEMVSCHDHGPEVRH